MGSRVTDMKCDTVRKTLSAFVDRRLAGGSFDNLSHHLEECRDCSAYARDLAAMHSALRSLPAAAPPVRLLTQLQVLASRERMRQISRGTLTALVHFWSGELQLFFDNLMRPLAIPFAGGLISALFLFAMLAPALQFPHRSAHDVLLSGLFGQTQATFDEIPPFGFSEDDVVVQVTLDRDGSVTDYSIPNNLNSKLRNDIANMILFTRYEPATQFGMPIAGKILVSFRRDRIVVKG
jgi:hypothetical protein